MREKPTNPYTTLRDGVRAFIRSVRHPRRVKMIWCKAENVNIINGRTIYERTLAAQQLGMRVEVKANNEGLHFYYVSQPDESDLLGA